MLEELFSEIAIEAIAPRKELTFSTSEDKSINAKPLSSTKTLWTLKYLDCEKTFTSRESVDEVATITIAMFDFFNRDWDNK